MDIDELVVEASESVVGLQAVVSSEHRKDIEEKIWVLTRAMKRGAVYAAECVLEMIGQDPYAKKRYGTELDEGFRWLEKALEYEKQHGDWSLLDINHPINREIFAHRMITLSI
tara:strand:- start:17286 stop:17624 length:339 start_codon:yes stop_codon:yes gene_type:complete